MQFVRTNTGGVVAPAGAGAEIAYRYAAFISYRHAVADRRWAKWLHSGLEAYRVPNALRARLGLPARAGRFFRDEEELSASADLSAEIADALIQSEYLIVVCSPRTPESQWVNKEVEVFRELGRHDRILALLIEGEPATAFPRALREIRRSTVDAAGVRREYVSDAEPLAADVRPVPGESPRALARTAKLRILAQLLGVQFDDLRRRDQARRARQAAVAGAALVGTCLALGGLAAAAAVQRDEARSHRAEADRQRGIANENARLAQIMTGEAKKTAAEAQRRVADLRAREGWAKMDVGDPSLALLWFTSALEAVHGDAAEEVMARVRVAAALRAAPRLCGILDDGTPPAEQEAAWRDVSGGDPPDRKPWLGGIPGPRDHADIAAKATAVAVGDLGGTFLGFNSQVSAAAFDGRGDRVWTAGLCLGEWAMLDESTHRHVRGGHPELMARAWDVRTCNGLTSPPVRYDGAAVLKDGQSLAVLAVDDRHVDTLEYADYHGLARRWDGRTGRTVGGTVFGPWIRPVSLSGDGARVVTIDDHGKVEVREVSTGKPRPTVPAGGPVTHAALSRDGKWLVTAGPDGHAQAWDAATGQSVGPAMPHGGPVNDVAFGPDGGRVVTAGADGAAIIWDAGTGAPVGAPMWHAKPVLSAAFSPDGGRIVTGCADGTTRLWDAATGRPAGPPVRHEIGVTSASLSPDGRRIVTVTADGLARLWDVAVALRGREAMSAERTTAGAAPAGPRTVEVADDGSGKARVYDAATRRPLTPPLDYLEETERRMLADPLLGPLHQRSMDIGVVREAGATFSPDGKRVALVVYNRTQLGYGEPRSDDRHVMAWDATSGKPVATSATWERHRGDILHVAFSADSGQVVTAGADGRARVTLLPSGVPRQVDVTPPHHDKAVNWAAFSPDGRRVVTASADGTARVWDAASGEPVTTPLPHPHEVVAAAFGPDGAWVVTACGDRAGETSDTRVWDAATGQPLSGWVRLDGHVRSVGFDPAGKRVVAAGSAGGSAGATWAWDVPTADGLTAGERETAHLMALAEVMAGHELDSRGGLMPLKRPQLMERYEALRRDGLYGFAPRPTTAPAGPGRSGPPATKAAPRPS